MQTKESSSDLLHLKIDVKKIKSVYIHKDIKHAFQQFLASWIQIGQGLVGILTLGFILPSWYYSYMAWLLYTGKALHIAAVNREEFSSVDSGTPVRLN